MAHELPPDFAKRKANAKTRMKKTSPEVAKGKRKTTANGGNRLSRSEGLALLDWKNEKREVNAEDIYKFAQMGATYEDIGRWYGVTKATIYQKISNKLELLEAYERGSGEMRMSLRRAQLINAIENCHPISQIWLGKQYLDQRDVPLEKESEDKKQTIPEWLAVAIKTAGNTAPSQASENSTATSPADTKGSPVQ